MSAHPSVPTKRSGTAPLLAAASAAGIALALARRAGAHAEGASALSLADVQRGRDAFGARGPLSAALPRPFPLQPGDRFANVVLDHDEQGMRIYRSREENYPTLWRALAARPATDWPTGGYLALVLRDGHIVAALDDNGREVIEGGDLSALVAMLGRGESS